MAWASEWGTPGPIQIEIGLGVGVAVGVGVGGGGEAVRETVGEGGAVVGVPVRIAGSTRDGTGVTAGCESPPQLRTSRDNNRPVVASAPKGNRKGCTLVLLAL
jgi:hypothetical protein